MLKKSALLAVLLGTAFAALMLTSRNADFLREDSLEMEHPPSAVWGVFVQAREWPHWWPGVETVSSEGELREGVRIDLTLKGNPGRGPVLVTTFSPPAKLEWEREGVLGSVTRTRLRLTPAGGGTVVALESHILGPQAVLARYASRDDFALYHEAVLRSLEVYLDQISESSVSGERP